MAIDWDYERSRCAFPREDKPMTPPLAETPQIGDRIRYTTKTAKRGWMEAVTREGVITCIWGNGWDGPHINTTTGTFIPSLGDTWEMIHDR